MLLLYARKALPVNGRTVRPGQPFHVEREREAEALVALQLARRADENEEIEHDAIAKPAPKRRGKDKKPRKKRGGYKRRDMRAEE